MAPPPSIEVSIPHTHSGRAKARLNHHWRLALDLVRRVLREDKYILPLYLVAAATSLVIGAVYCAIDAVVPGKIDDWLFGSTVVAMYVSLSVAEIRHTVRTANISDERTALGKIRGVLYTVSDILVLTLVSWIMALLSGMERTRKFAYKPLHLVNSTGRDRR